MISIALDVGQENDPAALAVLESTGARAGSHRPQWDVAAVGNIPLGTAYKDLAAMVANLGMDFQRAGYPVVASIDATGIGGAVVELARDAAPELHIIALTISGGRALTHQPNSDDYTVGKHRLTEVLQVALEQRGLTLPDTEGGRAARDQLRAFVRKPGRTGYSRHEAAGQGHDDLVLALELAVWVGDAMADEYAGVMAR